ncbi:MAG: 30S ribosomal protein S2 [Candidatus Omnitrophica bacterium]|nr:30S ribosomal protein S2 [Candidatus Omnitrophota bacterium]
MAIPEVISNLLNNGVHFGHLSKHWNPKMKQFIFGKKKNIYIIDLEKTAKQLDQAKDFVQSVVADGKKIMFVSTKRQLRTLIREQAASCQMPCVVERWIGGFLTNYPTVRVRVKKYIEYLEKKQNGEFDKLPGKEAVRVNRDFQRMEKNYSGVITMEELPGCLYVIDPKREIAAIREANKLDIPVVALIDTDADPEVVDYPVPGNDDAIKSVRYITSVLVEAINEGIKKAEEVRLQAKEQVAVKEEAVNSEELQEKPAKPEIPESA